MKGSTKRGRGVFGSSTQAVQQVLRLLEQSRSATHMRTYEHFCRSLAVFQAVLDQVKMAEWLEICAGMEHGLGPLSQALSVLLSEASSHYEDLLGSVYMVLGQGEKRLGQYFTPFPVAQMMAAMTLSDLQPLATGQSPIKILEPACGSGVMILAAAEHIERRYPGMIARGEVQFFGVDRDSICVAMCNLNMRLHRIGRIVTLASDLTEETNTTTEQDSGRPHLRAFQPARIVCGNAFDPETDRMLAQENPWIAVTEWPPSRANVSLPHTTEQMASSEPATIGAKAGDEEYGQKNARNGEAEPIPEEGQPAISDRQTAQAQPGKSQSISSSKRTRYRQRNMPSEAVQKNLFSPPE